MNELVKANDTMQGDGTESDPMEGLHGNGTEETTQNEAPLRRSQRIRRVPDRLGYWHFNAGENVTMQLVVVDWTRKDPFNLMVVVKRTQMYYSRRHVLVDLALSKTFITEGLH